MSKVLYSTDYFSLEKGDHGDFVRSGDEVLVVALDDEHNVILSIEPSTAFGEKVLIIAGGEIEPGEDVKETGNRELQEEVGYAAGSLLDLGELRPYSKYLAVRSFIVLARDLVPKRLEGDEGYAIETIRVPLDSFESLIDEGRLLDARVIAALFLARRAVAAEAR